jgi:hypothetical protein
MSKHKNKAKYVFIGTATAIAVFFALGIPTVIIPNNLFLRMTPVTVYDQIFLVLASALLGTYAALHFYSKKCSNDTYLASGGVLTSIFALGCPVCNALLVTLFGATALLTYFEPLRPILGLITVTMLGAAVFLKAKSLTTKKRKGLCGRTKKALKKKFLFLLT